MHFLQMLGSRRAQGERAAMTWSGEDDLYFGQSPVGRCVNATQCEWKMFKKGGNFFFALPSSLPLAVSAWQAAGRARILERSSSCRSVATPLSWSSGTRLANCDRPVQASSVFAQRYQFPIMSAEIGGALQTRTCGTCSIRAAQYCCPRCAAVYCSSDCYKRHSTTCTEAFYKESVRSALESGLVRSFSADAQKQMSTILEKISCVRQPPSITFYFGALAQLFLSLFGGNGLILFLVFICFQIQVTPVLRNCFIPRQIPMNRNSPL